MPAARRSDNNNHSNDQKAAAILGKPEKYISISITHDEALSFHGTFDPALLLVIVRSAPAFVLRQLR